MTKHQLAGQVITREDGTQVVITRHAAQRYRQRIKDSSGLCEDIKRMVPAGRRQLKQFNKYDMTGVNADGRTRLFFTKGRSPGVFLAEQVKPEFYRLVTCWARELGGQ